MREAMERTLRWLDRSLAANARPAEQNVFAIVQGGLDPDLRQLPPSLPTAPVPISSLSGGSAWRRWESGTSLGSPSAASAAARRRSSFGESSPFAQTTCPRTSPGSYQHKTMKTRLVMVMMLCRYAMGVGFAVDLVVCSALGVDMFDCVFPTRTARFGNALTPTGALNLNKKAFARDMSPIQDDCPCPTCKRPASLPTRTRKSLLGHMVQVQSSKHLEPAE